LEDLFHLPLSLKRAMVPQMINELTTVAFAVVNLLAHCES